jgi:hypothetical protein
MDDRICSELILTAIEHVGASGLRSLLCTSAEKISGGELRAVGTHDGYGHVPILAVHDVPHRILAERVADLAIEEAPVLPGYESPCADERIRGHRSSLVREQPWVMMPPADARCELLRTPLGDVLRIPIPRTRLNNSTLQRR